MSADTFHRGLELLHAVHPDRIAREILSVQPFRLPQETNMHHTTRFNIVVKKEALMDTLQRHQAAHQRTYEAAAAAYKAKVEEALRNRLAMVRKGVIKPEDYLTFKLPCPRFHGESYRQVLSMLEMDTRDQFEITSEQYAAWIEDRWDWREGFIATSALYEG